MDPANTTNTNAGGRKQSKPQGIPYHPLADIFPLIEDAEFEELVADIKARKKLLERIVLHQGMILDGRNRYRACVEAGLFKPSPDAKVHIKDKEHFLVLPSDMDAIGFVVSKNINRRHFKEGQRAYFAAKLANMRVGGKETNSANLQNCSQEQAAKITNVSTRSVASAVKVIEKGVPEIVEAVRDGKLAPSAAAEAVDLDPKDQKNVAILAKTGNKKAAAAKINEAKTSKANQSNDDKTGTKIAPPQSPLNADVEALQQAVAALAALYAKHVMHKNGMMSVAGFLVDVVPIENVKVAGELLYNIEYTIEERKREAEQAKRLAWEAKNPKKAHEKARDEAIECEMQSDMDEARQDAKDSGESWSAIKEDWIENWIADNWDEEAEAEFYADFRETWKREHGTDFPRPPASPQEGTSPSPVAPDDEHLDEMLTAGAA
jgi:hypothetical protein